MSALTFRSIPIYDTPQAYFFALKIATKEVRVPQWNFSLKQFCYLSTKALSRDNSIVITALTDAQLTTSLTKIN